MVAPMARFGLFPRITLLGLCVACSTSPSMILRSPVSDQCARAGLQSCEQLADGVLLYVDGRRDEAMPKLSAGAADNTPERLTRFTELLGALENLPGASKYSASLQGVVATINVEASKKAKRGADDGRSKEVRPMDREPNQREFPVRALSADADPRQLRDGLEISPTGGLGWCTEYFGEGTRCATVAQGPLYLTDAVPNGKSCEGQFLAVVSGDALGARFDAPLSIHGARIFVPSGSSLIFGQLAEPKKETSEPKSGEKATSPSPSSEKKPPRVVLDEASPEWSCLLYWSGFVPYRSR